jgi:hypothetical protein
MSTDFSVYSTGGSGLSALAFAPFDGQRRLISTSSRDGRVLIDDDGVFSDWTNTGGSPVGIAVDGQSVYVADCAHGAIIGVSDEGSLSVRCDKCAPASMEG